jgi:hypothetical protein
MPSSTTGLVFIFISLDDLKSLIKCRKLFVTFPSLVMFALIKPEFGFQAGSLPSSCTSQLFPMK